MKIIRFVAMGVLAGIISATFSHPTMAEEKATTTSEEAGEATAPITKTQESSVAAEPMEEKKTAPAGTTKPKGDGTYVNRSALCQVVTEREPQGTYEGETPTLESANEKAVFFWTEIKSDETPTKVKHLWSVGGETVGEIPLSVNYSRTRTWSSKNIWPGDWVVEAVAPNGEIMASTKFIVTKPE